MSGTFIRRPGFYFGLLAAMLATAAMIAIGDLWQAPVVPQLLSDRMTAELPVETFGRILEFFGSAAKPIAFAGIVIGQVLVGGFIGLLAESLLRRGVSPWLIAVGLLAGIWLLLSLIIAPLGGIGLFARDSVAGTSAAGLAFLAIAVVYSAALLTGIFSTIGRSEVAIDPGRRQFMRWATLGVPGLIAVVYLSRFMDGLAGRSAPPPLVDTEGELPSAITPTEDFYTVSKNLVDPTVHVGDWVLVVDGEVETDIGFTYDDLLEMESVTQITTLECISNTIGGPYISNAEWTGVRLRTILEQAGVRDGVVDVALHAEDGYSDSIPLEKALSDNVILAYHINGEQLPEKHGYPLRLIVPGIYGMKNVKWINRIELVNDVHVGFWQERGWSQDAPVQTMSKIVTPFHGSTVGLEQETLVGGVAFSGDRGISRVELSVDDGETWVDAEVEPALSESSWVRWWYDWTADEATYYDLTVRAYEEDGTMQTEDRSSSALPDGSTGWHEIGVAAEADYEAEDEEDDD